MNREEIKEWLKERALYGHGTVSQEILDYISELECELNRVKGESPHEQSEGDLSSIEPDPLNANSALFNKYGG